MKILQGIIIKRIQKIKQEWNQGTEEERFSMLLVRVIMIPVFVLFCFISVRNCKDLAELRRNHIYSYGVVEDVSFGNGTYHFTVSYAIGEHTYTNSWQNHRGAAHMGDTLLIMYSPTKPSYFQLIKYDGRYVTKRMVDFRAYRIDKSLIH